MAEACTLSLPIDHCELILIHVVPYEDEPKIFDRPKKDLSQLLTTEVQVAHAGRTLYFKLAALVQQHFNLCSTTVTGIPMKEEQNASSSANYDVELLHPAVAHEELKRQTGGHAEGLIVPSKEGLPTETVTLKWCTPKSSVVELHHCTSCHRITPVDVNSRPSSCLTNFLLGGRAVMLEQPRKSGTKVISHMLASHGGEIFIHTLSISRSILEDPPSISEGSGGRVTDYRITDFGEFMKENRLAPVSENPLLDDIVPIERAKNRLERLTRYWPMVISDTLIFNMRTQIEPIPTLIMKDKIDEDDVMECRKAIFNILGMESRNEAFPTTVTGSRGKGPKREEQYRQFWNELETLIRFHSDTSPMHGKILECLLDCKKPTEDSKKAASPKRGSEKIAAKEKMETTESEQSWKELDKFQKMTEREKQEMNSATDSKMEVPPQKMKKLNSGEQTSRNLGGQNNLFAMWTSRLNQSQSKLHEEFVGRAEHEGTGPAELYVHLKEENQAETRENTPPKTQTSKR